MPPRKISELALTVDPKLVDQFIVNQQGVTKRTSITEVRVALAGISLVTNRVAIDVDSPLGMTSDGQVYYDDAGPDEGDDVRILDEGGRIVFERASSMGAPMPLRQDGDILAWDSTLRAPVGIRAGSLADTAGVQKAKEDASLALSTAEEALSQVGSPATRISIASDFELAKAGSAFVVSVETPVEWSGVNVTAWWTVEGSEAGDVSLVLDIESGAPGDILVASTEGSVVDSSDGTANKVYSTALATEMTSPDARDVLRLSVYRGDVPADTLTGMIRLLRVVVEEPS